MVSDSKEDAWKNAEVRGRLQYQSVYHESRDKESKGYVVNLDERRQEEPPVSEEEYYGWMKEAIEKGMIVRPEEYEKAFGLPFHDVW
ncbi:MAG: hypothetical protein ACOYBE_01535 [Blautia sp.]